MGLFKKKTVKKPYDREHMKPVIRASICTGEEVAGFKDIRTGKIEEIFWPFGKEIVYGNGMFSFLVNLIWIVFFGWEMALGNLIVGCIWCITIVGIPFGKQFFKMARLSFMPFGASVIG